jgi:hypothetical protein
LTNLSLYVIVLLKVRRKMEQIANFLINLEGVLLSGMVASVFYVFATIQIFRKHERNL